MSFLKTAGQKKLTVKAPGYSERTAYIGAGSNTGNREENIAKALFLLEKHVESIQTASLYESRALYYENQPDFLNTVFRVILKGGTTPFKLLETVQKIENKLGRVRDPRNPKGPRTMDLDILLAGKTIITSKSLVIPHPGITERLFVLLPLLELDYSITDPVSGKKYSDFPLLLGDQGIHLFKSCRYIEHYRISGGINDT